MRRPSGKPIVTYWPGKHASLFSGSTRTTHNLRVTPRRDETTARRCVDCGTWLPSPVSLRRWYRTQRRRLNRGAARIPRRGFPSGFVTERKGGRGGIIGAMSTATLLTLEQFEQLPQEDGVRYELKDGEVVKMANAKFGHEQAKSEILSCLVPYVVQHRLGRVYAETSFALAPSRVCAPDVAFLSNESVAKGHPEHVYSGAPDLAIEVVSDSEIAEELRQKIQDYLDAGSKAVWAVYPKVRVVAVYDQSGVREYRGDQVLEAPEILPGFQAKVNQFFE